MNPSSVRPVAAALVLAASLAAAPVTGAAAGPAPLAQAANTVPVGHEIDVRLQTGLDSDTANVEDRFEAATVVDVMDGDSVLIPAGSLVRGIVSNVDRASRTDRTGELTLAFDEIVVNGESYPLRANATEVLKSSGIRGETGKIATGAGVGAIIGGIIGGVEGALTGVLIGAGGTIAATEGNDVELEPGTIIRIRLDQPLQIDR